MGDVRLAKKMMEANSWTWEQLADFIKREWGMSEAEISLWEKQIVLRDVKLMPEGEASGFPEVETKYLNDREQELAEKGIVSELQKVAIDGTQLELDLARRKALRQTIGLPPERK